ncbi:MAG: SDR family NAD(P)-dependent oxidoreductase [Legionellales bacterium]|nr:SDR family NAD(P)-dependent oxidoreductase [Legionellales bacterium]
MFVVTGGGSGLGKALAYALADRQHSVIIVGRREQAMSEVAAYSSHISLISADVSTHEGRDILCSRLRKYERISGLVHNAGIIDPIAPLSTLDEKAWRQAISTNLDAPLFLNQGLNSQLINGRVLHMGSGAAYFPVVGWSAYCVSKAALSMLTRCWQLECTDVSFASVMPGIIDTPMQKAIRESTGMDVEKQQFFKGLHEDKRLLTPETVASFLCWLLLDLDKTTYASKEWDIYDTTHHEAWLKPPHEVPHWE